MKQFGVDNAKAWMDDTPCGVLAHGLVVRGYSFDYISDAQLGKTHAEGDGLKTPGAEYRALLVPRTSHMPPATLHQLLELASAGATVVFVEALPANVPGYGSLSERRAQFKAELARLHFEAAGARGLRQAAVGRGRVLLGDSIESAVAGLDAAREPVADSGLGVLRRRTADGEIYFIANLTARPFDGWVKLGRSTAAGAVLMDARSGRTGVAALRSPGSRAEVYLQLEPSESIFVRTLTGRQAHAPAWHYFEDAGAPIPLAGQWHVSFTSGGPELPPAFSEPHLGSWTDQGGEAERYAGTARYVIEATLPDGVKADDWRLDLGDVRETARVLVNGKEVDRLWSLPFWPESAPGSGPAPTRSPLRSRI